VERWFGLLTDKLIRRGVHTSVAALEKDIQDWIAPRPARQHRTRGAAMRPAQRAALIQYGTTRQCGVMA
jgi:hypothetical protein